MELPPEYVEYLNKNLNLFERMTQIFSSLDERIDYTNILLTKLLEAQGGTPELSEILSKLSASLDKLINVGFAPVSPNATDFVHGSKTLVSADEAVQLTTSSIPVPDGFVVTVMAFSTNSGVVYVGRTKSDTEGSQAFGGLDANVAISLKIANVNMIWVQPSSANDSVSWITCAGVSTAVGSGLII